METGIRKFAILARPVTSVPENGRARLGRLRQTIEDVLRHKLIPAITGKHHLNDADRSLFSLPPKLGGLGIKIPIEMAQQEFDNSLTVTKPPVLSILEDVNPNIEIIREDQNKAR